MTGMHDNGALNHRAMPAQPPGAADPARVVAAAQLWLGTPYRHQASLRGVGCDCLGLIRGVWRALNGPEPETLPPYSPHWAETGAGDPLLAMAGRHLLPATAPVISPGEVLLFRWRDGLPAKHCGIALGAGRFIHAHDGVAVAAVSLPPAWQRRLAGRFLFPDRRI